MRTHAGPGRRGSACAPSASLPPPVEFTPGEVMPHPMLRARAGSGAYRRHRRSVQAMKPQRYGKVGTKIHSQSGGTAAGTASNRSRTHPPRAAKAGITPAPYRPVHVGSRWKNCRRKADGVRIRWQTSKIAVLEKGIPSPDPDAGTGTTARCNPGTGPARAGTRSTPGRTPTRSLLHMPKTTALQLQGAPPGFSSRCWTFRCLDCDSVRHSCPCPYFKKRAEISPGRQSYSSERPEAPRRFVRCRHSPPAHPVGAGCRAV